MTTNNTPDAKVNIDIDLVVLLLATQFPQWVHLPIEPVESAGTDNALFRLGDDMAIRMPRVDWAIEQVDKEQRWLPRLAPRLPLAIPIPLARGSPNENYPWAWSVYRWLDGEDAYTESIDDLNQAATDLANFVTALHRIDPTGGPRPGKHNFYRGIPLAKLDSRVRSAIDSLDSLIDTDAVSDAWRAALQVPTWRDPPVWVHGDIHAGNLLTKRGRLSAVIDFGGLGVGDPACDLIVAWNLLTAESRDVFRAAVRVDDATWARGRGWALSIALIALPYYLDTNPKIVRTCKHVINEILADDTDSIRP